MRISRPVLLTTLLVVVVLQHPVFSSNAPQSFSIVISTAQTEFKAGSKVELQIALTNTSNQSLAVRQEKGEPSAELDGFVIAVRDSSSTPARETKYGRVVTGKEESTEGLVSSGVQGSLPPRQTFKDATILNKLFDITKAGKYKIQVSRFDTITKTWVMSNEITVVVTP